MPDARPAIAFCAHDAGGARALLPVVAELRRRRWELVSLLAGPAVGVFAGTPFAGATADDATQEQIAETLLSSRAAVLLSASGLYNTVEHTARLAARRLGLPVVAVQDAWFNHDERYRRNGVDSLPDHICAMDELSLAEFERAGFVRAQIELTGHPGLEQTVARCRAVTPLQVSEKRRQFGLPDSGLLLAFFSDPFYTGPHGEFYSGPGAIMRPDGRGLYGYTVRDVLPALMAELELALDAADIDANLVVKPHPSECDAVVRGLVAAYAGRRLRACVETRGTTEDWIQMSDALLGMMTIALLEAALAGKPVASIEPGLRESGQEDPCMANTLGYAEGVFDIAALRGLCERLARQDWASLRRTPRHALPVEGATTRVTDCLLRVARLA